MKTRLEESRKRICRVVEEELGSILDQFGGNPAPDPSPCPKISCARRERYRAVLASAVRDLEETRRSFRSARLGKLRTRLQRALKSLPPSELTA